MSAGLSSGTINACERTSFVFLRQELPVRLSNIMKEINLLPDRLLETPSVQLVQSWWDPSLSDHTGFGLKPSKHKRAWKSTTRLVKKLQKLFSTKICFFLKSYSTFNPCAMNSRSTCFNQRLRYRAGEGGREGGGRAGELCPSSSDFPCFCFFTPPSFLVFALAENSEFQTAALQLMANSHHSSPFTKKWGTHSEF